MSRKYLKVALLAIPLMVLAPMPAMSSSVPSHAGSMMWFLLGFELGPWEDYLARELTPELDLHETLPEPRVSWISHTTVPVLPAFAEKLVRQPQRGTTVVLDRDSSRLISARTGSARDTGLSHGLRREMVAPGINHQFSERTAFSVSALLATQEFGSALLGVREEDRYWHRGTGAHHGPQRTVTHGAGLRMGVITQPFAGVSLNASVQSRIDMDELAEHRGLHNRAAELDIPPRASVGMEVQSTRRSFINVAVDQVFYSDVSAFPSRAMPARFLALLGDSSSPEFAWRDLTVYTVGWRWVTESDFQIHAYYSTRTQPSPTSRSLARALDNELAENSFLLGFSQGMGPNRRFELSASYAPPEYAFGGNVLGVITDQLDQSVEVQAGMNWRF